MSVTTEPEPAKMDEPEVEFTPRAYQIDIYEKAIKENTIIYLPTGSGKTYIAIMVIKKYSDQVQLPYSQGGKRIIFVVNTVPLVLQQTLYIARHTGLCVRGYSGDMGVDFWDKKRWHEELESAQVLVMVAAIFSDMLHHNHMRMNEVALVIFDECHKAVGNHPMRTIMRQLEFYDKKEHPRIMGLTATLLNANVKLPKVEDTLRALEITLHGKIISANSDGSLKQYGCAEEKIVRYDPSERHGLEAQLNEIIDHSIKVLSVVRLEENFEEEKSSRELVGKSKNVKLANLIEDTREHINTMGLYGGAKAILMHTIQLECMKKSTEDALTIGILEFLVTQMTKMKKIIEDEMAGCSELEKIYRYSSNKVLTTFEILRETYDTQSASTKFCTIIFVQRRATAQVLYYVLNELSQLNERFNFLSPDYILGYANNPFKNPREWLCLSKWNKEALTKFRQGRTNCIVATDVIDEGIDIPTCTFILRYQPPLDFRGYIQSRGRARHESSLYVILLPKDDENFVTKYQSFQRVGNYLNKTLIGHDDRVAITSDELKNSLYQSDLEPYIVSKPDGTHSMVTAVSAIGLINRYCDNLNNSKFTRLTAIWKLHKIPSAQTANDYKVDLTLPLKSPLKRTIEGAVMDSICDAKRSAALNTCVELHKIGELSDHLLPIKASAVLETSQHLFPHWQEETVVNIGTKANKRTHPIAFPKELYQAFPEPDKKLYLHLIQAKPSYAKPYESRQKVFYDLLNDDAGFAMLTTTPLSQIPGFPIFMNVGSLDVRIKENDKTLTLSASQIEKLKLFHWIIFNDVLGVLKNFMVFDLENKSNCFLVVPTDKSGNICWSTVEKYRSVEEEPPSEIFRPSDYELALVTPNYRSSSSVYVVTEVCDDLMAESAFPSEDFNTYMHYYQERHGLIIRNPKQPMLEVKAISKKINCIRPRSIKAGLSKRKRADLLEEFEEHFVTELCNRTIFPAVYWLKATYLPSVLHRINQLLVANDLRVQIIREAFLGQLEHNKGVWPPLIVEPLSCTSNKDQSEIQTETSIVEDTCMDASPIQVDTQGPEINTLESNLYPWKKESEPTNLYKAIEQIQLIDIEYYYQFMATPLSTDNEILRNQNRAKAFQNRAVVPVPPLHMLNQKDPIGPSAALIMRALTAHCAHDVFNLERLETLGDSFLKFAVSLFLHHTYPDYNEGQLTALKGKMIGNRNLFYCGNHKRIPGRMKVDEFVPMNNFIATAFSVHRPLQDLLLSNEVPPNVLYELTVPPTEQYSGKLSNETLSKMEENVLSWVEQNSETGMENFLETQLIPDKSVADCVEALIGVYLSSMGVEAAFKILKWFGILPTNLKSKDLLGIAAASSRIGSGNPGNLMPRKQFIEQKIGYQFSDSAYLLEAFTHPSYTPNTITGSYERLEFLGDAILDFLITVHIYESCDNLSPGALTDLRSALVNNITFACLAVKYGFHVGLLAYAPQLQEVIERFVKFQSDRDFAIDDELLWILLDEEDCNMAEYVDVPKVLGDIFESVIGAIYLDTGKNLAKVWEIVYSLMKDELIAFSQKVPKQPIRVIHETPGAHPRFSKPKSVDEMTMISLEVTIAGKVKLFHGFGANSKQAKCAAAKQALKTLRNNV